MAIRDIDIGAAAGRGIALGSGLRQLAQQEEETRRASTLRSLAPQAFTAPRADRASTLAQVARVDPAAAFNWQDTLSRMDATALQQHAAEAPYFVGALGGVTDQAGYDAARQRLMQQGIDVSDMDDAYDPRMVSTGLEMYRAVAGMKAPAPSYQNVPPGGALYRDGELVVERPAAAKDPLSSEGKLRADFRAGLIDQAQFDAGMDRLGKGGGGPFEGTNLDAQAMNLLLQGDPASPEYLAAYNHLAQAKDYFNQQTGQWVRITPNMSAYRQPAAAGGQGAGSPAGTTAGQGAGASMQQVGPPILGEGEKSAAGFANRLASSHDVLSKFEGQAADFLKGTIEGFVPNILKSSDRQQYEQAQRDFVNAQLRRESGAAIQVPEWDNANQQYFPQPGDKPAVIEQKRRSRELAIENMRASAGRAPTKQPEARQPQENEPGYNSPPPPEGYVRIK